MNDQEESPDDYKGLDGELLPPIGRSMDILQDLNQDARELIDDYDGHSIDESPFKKRYGFPLPR